MPIGFRSAYSRRRRGMGMASTKDVNVVAWTMSSTTAAAAPRNTEMLLWNSVGKFQILLLLLTFREIKAWLKQLYFKQDSQFPRLKF